MQIPLFLIPILTGLIAQGLKRVFNQRLFIIIDEHGHKIPRYGGMPSAHTAFATSLLTVTLVADGLYSASFAIACALFILIIDDALRMRLFLGRFGAALQKLVKRLPPEQQRGFPYLESQLGHKPREVVAGAVLGIAVSLIVLFFFGI